MGWGAKNDGSLEAYEVAVSKRWVFQGELDPGFDVCLSGVGWHAGAAMLAGHCHRQCRTVHKWLRPDELI